jgi:hypothetical protein
VPGRKRINPTDLAYLFAVVPPWRCVDDAGMPTRLVLLLTALAALTPVQAEAAARHPVTIRSLSSPHLVIARRTQVEHYGRLTRTDTGEPLGNVTFDLAVVPDVGPVRTLKVTTDAQGLWLAHERSLYSATVRTYFPGNATDAPAFATSYRLPVTPLMTVTSPATGAHSSVRSPLVVRGTTLPAKPGALLHLARFDGTRFVDVATTRVVGDAFVFSAALPHGAYTLKVIIGRTNGSYLGSAPAFSAIRV